LGILAFIGVKIFTTTPPSITNTTPTPVPNTFPAVTPTPAATPTTPVNHTISIATSNGSTIAVNDFSQDPDLSADQSNPGYYYLGYHYGDTSTDPKASDSPPYVIEYINATQYFNIALMQEPIKTTREQVEQYLMQHLGISQSQMCQLKYTVSVPASVNQTYAGISLGFSFCSGSVQLP